MLPFNRLMEKKILDTINSLVQRLIEMSCLDEAEKIGYMHEAAGQIREIRPLLLKLINGQEEHLESLVRQLVFQKLPPPAVLSSFGNLQKDLAQILSISASNLQQNTPAEETTKSEETSSPRFDEKCLETGNKTLQEEGNSSTPGKDTSQPEKEALLVAPVCAEPESTPDLPLESPLPVPETAGFTPAPANLQDIINSIYAKEKIIKDYLFRSLHIDYYLPAKKIGIISKTHLLRKYKIHDLLLKKAGISLVEFDPVELGNIHLLSRKLSRYS